MNQLKELQALQRKGLDVGKTCEIVLSEAIGYRNADGEYVRYAEKGQVVPCLIAQKTEKRDYNQPVFFKVVFNRPHEAISFESRETIWVDLTKAKAR